jgi:hypothetical protein
LIWTGNASPFYRFLALSDWLYTRTQRTDSIALVRLMELLFEFLTCESGVDEKQVAETLWRDYQRGGRYDKPGFMKHLLDTADAAPRRAETSLPKRQSRHLV